MEFTAFSMYNNAIELQLICYLYTYIPPLHYCTSSPVTQSSLLKCSRVWGEWCQHSQSLTNDQSSSSSMQTQIDQPERYTSTTFAEIYPIKYGSPALFFFLFFFGDSVMKYRYVHSCCYICWTVSHIPVDALSPYMAVGLQ